MGWLWYQTDQGHQEHQILLSHHLVNWTCRCLASQRLSERLPQVKIWHASVWMDSQSSSSFIRNVHGMQEALHACCVACCGMASKWPLQWRARQASVPCWLSARCIRRSSSPATSNLLFCRPAGWCAPLRAQPSGPYVLLLIILFLPKSAAISCCPKSLLCCRVGGLGSCRCLQQGCPV